MNKNIEKWCEEVGINVSDMVEMLSSDYSWLNKRLNNDKKSITIQIGNSDDKLSQSLWSDFISDVRLLLSSYTTHFSGGSNADTKWQNYCFVVEIPKDKLDIIRESLSTVCKKYNQDSIAFSIGNTEFIN